MRRPSFAWYSGGLISALILLATTLLGLIWLALTALPGPKEHPPLAVHSARLKNGPDGEKILQLQGTGLNPQTQVLISPDLTNQHQILHRIRTWQRQFGVAANDHIVVIADNKNGLQVLDRRRPEAPTLLTSVPLPGRAVGVTLAGDIAYVGCSGAGLAVIDLAVPETPRVLARLDTPGFAGNLVIRHNRLYLADGPKGVQVIDISRPTAPRLLHTLATDHFAWDLVLQDNLLLVADGTAGLKIARLSPGGPPTIIGRAPSRGTISSVTINGRFAYIAGWRTPLQCLDLRDPTHPTLVYTDLRAGRANGLTLDKGRLYLSNRNGLMIFDTDPTGALHLVGEINTDTEVRQLWARDGLAYAIGVKRFYVVDVSRPQPLPAVQKLPLGLTLSQFTGMAIMSAGKDDALYLLDKRYLRTIRHPPGEGFRETWSTAFPSPLTQVHRDGNSLFISDAGGTIYPMDLTDPTLPLMTARFQLSHPVTRLTTNRHLLAAASSDTISLLDKATGHPRGQLVLNGHAITDMAFYRNWLYVACRRRGLLVIDTSNPEAPRQVHQIRLPWPENHFSRFGALKPVGNRLYLTNHELGMVVMDLTRPATPEIIHNLQFEALAVDLALSDHLALVQASKENLRLVDFSDPSSLNWLGEVPGTSGALDYVVKEERLFLTDKNGELKVLGLPQVLQGNLLETGHYEAVLPDDLPEGVMEIQINNYGAGRPESQKIYLEL